MIDRQRPVSSPRRSAAVAGAGLAALLWGAGCGALAQDQSAPTAKPRFGPRMRSCRKAATAATRLT
jgi:hypothetical protein